VTFQKASNVFIRILKSAFTFWPLYKTQEGHKTEIEGQMQGKKA